MIYKKSSEIQKIFALSRDDINRLNSDGVLKPKKCAIMYIAVKIHHLL